MSNNIFNDVSVSSFEAIDLDKILNIAQINPLYQLQLDWFSTYGINQNMIPMGLSFLLLIFLITKLFISGKNPTLFSKTVGIGFVAILFSLSLIPIPAMLQELDTTDYAKYMSNVEANIVKELQNLNDSEKALLSFCLKDGANINKNNGITYFKNHANSGERFDKCIVRFASHSKNPIVRDEFMKMTVDDMEKQSQVISKIRHDKLNTPLENLNESVVGVKENITQAAKIILDGKVGELQDNISQKLHQETGGLSTIAADTAKGLATAIIQKGMEISKENKSASEPASNEDNQNTIEEHKISNQEL